MINASLPLRRMVIFSQIFSQMAEMFDQCWMIEDKRIMKLGR